MNPTENCPHCGAKYHRSHDADYECNSLFWPHTGTWERGELCREREARQKTEAELAHYKREFADAVKACEPLRKMKGLQLGDNITTRGVELMLEENQKLRELMERSLKISPLTYPDSYLTSHISRLVRAKSHPRRTQPTNKNMKITFWNPLPLIFIGFILGALISHLFWK